MERVKYVLLLLATLFVFNGFGSFFILWAVACVLLYLTAINRGPGNPA